MYQDRIGGALLGDVFEIGTDDILSLKLTTSSGLEKSTSGLSVELRPTGGLAKAADGQYVVCKSGGGLASDASGMYISSVGGATFAIISCPAGTNPVADKVEDTLNFTGTGITITGNAATDTVHFEVSSHTRLHSVTDTDDHSFPGGKGEFLQKDGTWGAQVGWGNLDNGHPDSTFGGISPVDCGGVT